MFWLDAVKIVVALNFYPTLLHILHTMHYYMYMYRIVFNFGALVGSVLPFGNHFVDNGQVGQANVVLLIECSDKWIHHKKFTGNVHDPTTDRVTEGANFTLLTAAH